MNTDQNNDETNFDKKYEMRLIKASHASLQIENQNSWYTKYISIENIYCTLLYILIGI